MLILADRQTQVYRPAEVIGGFFMADIELWVLGVSYDDSCGFFRYRDERWGDARALERCVGLQITRTGDLSKVCGTVHSAYRDGDSVRGLVRLIAYDLIEIVEHHLDEYEFHTELDFIPGDDDVIESDSGESIIIEGKPRALNAVILSVFKKGDEDYD